MSGSSYECENDKASNPTRDLLLPPPQPLPPEPEALLPNRPAAPIRIWARHNAVSFDWVAAERSDLNLNIDGPLRRNYVRFLRPTYIRLPRRYIAPYELHMAGTSMQQVNRFCDHDECVAGPSSMYLDRNGRWCHYRTNTPIPFASQRCCRLKAKIKLLETVKNMMENQSYLSLLNSSDYYTTQRDQIDTILLEKAPDHKLHK